MTKKKLLAKSNSPGTLASQPSLVHRLDALLHTMRCIAQHEDELCELSHEVKRSAVPTSDAIDALRVILDKIPSMDYVHDLDAVNKLLDQPTAIETSPSKPVAEKFARKSSKSSGRKSKQRADKP